MDEIELHVSINADLVIPEWLRKKMGLTEVKDDAEVESEDRDDESSEEDLPAEIKAQKEALDKLAKAMRDNGIADVSFTYRDSARNHLK